MTHPASTRHRRCRTPGGGTGWRVVGVGVVASLVLLAASASDAGAALWVRISLVPTNPMVGEATRVSVLTFYFTQEATDQDRCANDLLATPIPYAVRGQAFKTFEIEASKDGLTESIVVPLDRRAGDSTYWDGAISFPSPGQWTLRLVHPGFPEPYTECAGAKAVVTVLPATLPAAGGGGGAGDDVPISGAVLAMAGVLLVMMVSSRAARRGRP